MIVVRTVAWAEQALSAGEIGCRTPGAAAPSHGGDTVATGASVAWAPRPSTCARGGRAAPAALDPILLPAAVQPRLADTTEVIGTALASKAAGHGHRHIATELDRSPSTVRRWLRRATRSAHLDWLWQRGSQALIRLDPDAFNQLPRATHPLRDALTVLTAAACSTRQRLGFNEPLWTLIGLHAHGRLLAAPT